MRGGGVDGGGGGLQYGHTHQRRVVRNRQACGREHRVDELTELGGKGAQRGVHWLARTGGARQHERAVIGHAEECDHHCNSDGRARCNRGSLDGVQVA